MSTIQTTNLKHESSGSNNIVLDSSGRVGIGTGSPSELLHVSGGHILLSNGYDIKSPDNFAIYDTTNSIDRFTYSGSNVYNTPSGGAHLFRINGTESARIISGGGITFNGDTAAANALDDYEEGTFTPTVVGETAAGTTTYATQTGSYTKIGRLVTVIIRITYTAATGSGNLQIGGLPFVASNICIAPVEASSFNWTGGTYLLAYLDSNQSFAYVVSEADDAARTFQQISNEAATFNLTMTYFV